MTSINILGNSASDGSFELLETIPLLHEKQQQSCFPSRCLVTANTILIVETSPGLLACRDLANLDSIKCSIRFPSSFRLHHVKQIKGCPLYLIGFITNQEQTKTDGHVGANKILWGLLDIAVLGAAMQLESLDFLECDICYNIRLDQCESVAVEEIIIVDTNDFSSGLLPDRNVVYHVRHNS